MEDTPEQDEIDEFFETYDTNKDGKVTFEEILAADEELRKHGDEYDHDDHDLEDFEDPEMADVEHA